MSIQDIDTLNRSELLSKPGLFSFHFPKSMLPAVLGDPIGEGLSAVFGIEADKFINSWVLPMADDNWTHMVVQVCLVVEGRPVQGFLVSFNMIILVVLCKI